MKPTTMTVKEIKDAINVFPDDLVSPMIVSSLFERLFEWRKWADEIPFIQWPSEWKIKAVPPFCGAVIRYWIEKPNGNRISVYLDCYGQLGWVGHPYWEAYPVDGDTFRCAMNETKELLEAIERGG